MSGGRVEQTIIFSASSYEVLALQLRCNGGTEVAYKRMCPNCKAANSKERIMKIMCSLLMAVCCAFSYTAQAEDAKLAPAPAEAHKVVKEDKAVVIDVREKEEFAKSHLPGAR